MNRSTIKVRDRAGLDEFEQRVLGGEALALRALVRQACGPNTLELPFRSTELRAAPNGTGGSRLLFTGYACTTDQPYEMQDWLGPYTEIVRLGAFAKTLMGNPDTIFCLNHDWIPAPMARTTAGTLELNEQIDGDLTGLLAEAQIDGQRSDVYNVQSAMEAKELNAMSFAFWTTRQTWSPDYEQRDILEVDIDGGDVSVVTWPANPTTTGTTALRKRQAAALLRTRVPALIVAQARAERRAGATLSANTMDVLQQVLDLIAGADVGLDAAQPLLAELMGVPDPNDPDADETAGETETDSAGTPPAAPAGTPAPTTGAKRMSRSRLQLLEDARRPPAVRA